jgi:5-formyltetrahydrofolate cyclo-ligase
VERTKREWRTTLQRARRERAAERERAGLGLAEVALAAAPVREAGCVALYLSMPPEPDTSMLLEALAGRRVLLPVLLDDDDLGWGEPSSGLETARLGLTQPVTDLGVEEIRRADVVICPALAVDLTGVRLGRGGGSYDRALARVDAPVIAAVYDDEVVEALPSDPHDRRVDYALTPTRLVPLSAPPGRA